MDFKKVKSIVKYGYVCVPVFLLAILVSSFIVENSLTKNLNRQVSQAGIPDHTIWGSSAAPFPDEQFDRREAWKRLNDKLKSLNGGYGLEARRSYDRAIPVNFAASAMAADVGLCNVSFGSFKPNWAETANGKNNEAIRKFIQSIPNDRIVYLIFNHEPENEVTRPGNSVALLQEAFARFVDIVLTSGKPNVHPCFNLMSYTFKPESKRNPDDFNLGLKLKPGQKAQVIAALDGYADQPEVSAKEIFEANFAKLSSWGFTRFGIFETGAHVGKTPEARAKWIEGLGKWVNSRKDIELVSYFNSGVGDKKSPAGWYLGKWAKNGTEFTWDDSDGTVSAYAQLLKPKKR